MLSARQRAIIAGFQGIRGPPVKAVGASVARAFGIKDNFDLSSGDITLCFPGERSYPKLDRILVDTIEKAHGHREKMFSYGNSEYPVAQRCIGSYIGYDVSDEVYRRAQVIAGISGATKSLIRYAANALEASETIYSHPLFVFCEAIHPAWLQAIVEEFGFAPMRIIQRTPEGYPDLEDAERVFRSIDRPFVYIAVPDENPASVATPNRYYFNSEGTGILNRIRTSRYDSFFIHDAIYEDVARGPHAGQRKQLVEAAKELGIRMIKLHSLSKSFKRAGLRIGGSYYAGPMDRLGQEFCRYMHNETQWRINNGIPSTSLAILQIAYSSDQEIEAEKISSMKRLEDRVMANGAFLLSQGLHRIFPDAQPTAAFYDFLDFSALTDGEQIPWEDPMYREWLMTTVTEKLMALGDPNVLDTWKTLRDFGCHRISASNVFALELAANGILALPPDPFYPLFRDDDLNPFLGLPMHNGHPALALRLVTAYASDYFKEAFAVLRKVLNEAIEAYHSGKYQNRYR